MNIILKNNKGFSWYSNKTIFVKGYFFDEKNNFYDKEKLIHFLEKIETENQFLKVLKSINGTFSIILKLKKSTCLASDTTRSFPLFYTSKNDDFFVCDDISHLKNLLKINEFDELSEIEFKASLHTHGNKTLLKNVFQVQSNEYIIIEDKKNIKREFFFSYATKKNNLSDYNTLKKQTVKAFENAFERLIKSLQNKPVVIPLSGGFDSRLIVTMLKKYNYKNVICYTYGNKNSYEIENSKKTAKILNYKWVFIEYSEELIKNYLQTNDFKDFAHYAGKFSASPHLQEYFAVKYLKENDIITKNAVFIPGYSGDLLGGSQFIKVIPPILKTIEVAELLLKQKFYHNSLSRNNADKIKETIKKNLLKIDKNFTKKKAYSVFEDYDIKEKIAKHIFNSASFYTFFGYQHRFPFWDIELLTFFKDIPVKHKIGKLLFNDVLINEYFRPFNICFKKELQPSIKTVYAQNIKDIIKPFLPTFVKSKLLIKNDSINYEQITQQMILSVKKNHLKTTKAKNNYNEIIAQWYLYFAKGLIK